MELRLAADWDCLQLPSVETAPHQPELVPTELPPQWAPAATVARGTVAVLLRIAPCVAGQLHLHGPAVVHCRQ